MRRDPHKVKRKWSYLKSHVNAKNYEIMHPKTGGGMPKKLNDVEQDIIDFLVLRHSFKIEGIPGGVDTIVIRHFHLKEIIFMIDH